MPTEGTVSLVPARVLVRSVNWLGDAVMSMPALVRLRELWPKAHLTVLAHEKLAQVWELHPAINGLQTFGKKDTVFSVARRLRPGNFSLALVFPNSPRSALEAWLARIPQRIGYARPWRNWFLTTPVAPRKNAVLLREHSTTQIQNAIGGQEIANVHNPDSHHLFDYLHLAAACGANPQPLAPALVAPDAEMTRARAWLPERPQPGWFGLNAGAEYGLAKRWPPERFIAAAVEIHRQTGCGWVIVGGPGDAVLAEQIETGIRREIGPAPLVNLAGKTSLRELCAVLKLCRVVLTNDTGPMHLAAAMGTPVVAPFGSTSPELTGPGLPGSDKHIFLKANVPCSPCFRRECPIDFRCMANITVEQVVAAVLRLA